MPVGRRCHGIVVAAPGCQGHPSTSLCCRRRRLTGGGGGGERGREGGGGRELCDVALSILLYLW